MVRHQVVVPDRSDFVVTRTGVSLACHRQGTGDGTPVVLVHGGGVDSSFFAATAEILARRRVVVSYDRRGYGESGDPADGDWSTNAQVGDLAAVCEAAGAGGRVVLAGHSLGGGIALWLAEAQPGLIGALVLHEPVGWEGPGSAEGRSADWAAIARLAASGDTTGAIIAALRLQGEPDPAAPPLTEAEVAHVDRNLATMVTHDVAGIAGGVDLGAVRIALQGIPVGVSSGELSRGTAAETAGAAVATALGCPLTVVPGAHNSPRDRPERFARLADQLAAAQHAVEPDTPEKEAMTTPQPTGSRGVR